MTPTRTTTTTTTTTLNSVKQDVEEFNDGTINIVHGSSYNNGISSYGLAPCLKSIGECAFADCESLKDITLPDSVQEISYYAFGHCEALDTFHFPDSLRIFNDGVLYGCYKLRHVHFPKWIAGGNKTATRTTTAQTDIAPACIIERINELLFLCDVNRGGREFLQRPSNNNNNSSGSNDDNNDSVNKAYPSGLWPLVLYFALNVVQLDEETFSAVSFAATSLRRQSIAYHLLVNGAISI